MSPLTALHGPADDEAAVTVDGVRLSRHDLLRQAAGVAAEIAGMPVVAVHANGYRVGAGEVEDALLAHPAVQEAAVIGTPHADLGEQVTAYVVADGARPEELIAYVAAHKRPRLVHIVDQLPRNAMGKIQKTLLRSAE